MIELKITGENLADVLKQLSLVTPAAPASKPEEPVPAPAEPPKPSKKKVAKPAEEKPAEPETVPVEAPQTQTETPAEQVVETHDPVPEVAETASEKPTEASPIEISSQKISMADCRKALLDFKNQYGREALAGLFKHFNVAGFPQLEESAYADVMAYMEGYHG